MWAARGFWLLIGMNYDQVIVGTLLLLNRGLELFPYAFSDVRVLISTACTFIYF